MTEAAAAPKTNMNETASTEAAAPADAALAQAEAARKEAENKYLYLYAEFENFKKRMAKERQDLVKFGWESTARELLGVLDNLDLALKHLPPGVDANLKKGLEMVFSHFQSTMEKQGVTPISTEGQMFNPDLHEAMGQEPSDQPAGTILRELARGYTLHGRLLRAARVMLSQGPA